MSLNRQLLAAPYYLTAINYFPMPSTPPPIHELLLASGIEFIEQSLMDFKTGSYKFSVIHFSSGIEVIMKARLCQQDYQLILSDRRSNRNLSEAGFRNGDGHTIGPKDCMKKLRDELLIALPAEGGNWSELAQLRNRAIHFVLDDGDSKLPLLHYKSFYDLKSFIRDQRLPFKPFRKRLKNLDNALGALVKQRYEPHIDDLYRLLEMRMIRIQRQTELTRQLFRSVADRYFSLTDKAPTLTLDQVAKVGVLSPRKHTEKQRIYRRYGNELSRIHPADTPVQNAFTLSVDRDSSDLDFIEFQLTYRWPRIQYYATGLSLTLLNLSHLKQTSLRWPAASEREKATAFLMSISKKITALQRQQKLLGQYHEGLRQRSFT